VTRAAGDIHPFGNPHYLLDPLNGKIVAATIASALKRVDPASSEVYDANLGKFQDEIDRALFGSTLVDEVGGAKLDRLARSGELDSFLEATGAAAKLGGWMGAMKPLRSTSIVTYHRNLSYFVQRFGIEVAGFVELKPGIPPSAKHLVDVVALIKSRGIQIIATQPFYDDRAPAMVAEKTGATVVVMPSSTDQVPGADTYLDLFEVMVKKLTAAAR
jgi:ABC-type Zn uptake system ZnuABC Zn-binding protein ZnuA